MSHVAREPRPATLPSEKKQTAHHRRWQHENRARTCFHLYRECCNRPLFCQKKKKWKRERHACRGARRILPRLRGSLSSSLVCLNEIQPGILYPQEHDPSCGTHVGTQVRDETTNQRVFQKCVFVLLHSKKKAPQNKA